MFHVLNSKRKTHTCLLSNTLISTKPAEENKFLTMCQFPELNRFLHFCTIPRKKRDLFEIGKLSDMYHREIYLFYHLFIYLNGQLLGAWSQVLRCLVVRKTVYQSHHSYLNIFWSYGNRLKAILLCALFQIGSPGIGCLSSRRPLPHGYPFCILPIHC